MLANDKDLTFIAKWALALLTWLVGLVTFSVFALLSLGVAIVVVESCHG